MITSITKEPKKRFSHGTHNTGFIFWPVGYRSPYFFKLFLLVSFTHQQASGSALSSKSYSFWSIYTYSGQNLSCFSNFFIPIFATFMIGAALLTPIFVLFILRTIFGTLVMGCLVRGSAFGTQQLPKIASLPKPFL